jgi:nicotinamide mononucleotide transporter
MTTPAATVVPAAVRPQRPVPGLGLAPLEAALVLSAAALAPLASWLGLWPIATAEAWGFATGLVCVWLVVREQPSSWPVGLLNNAFFLVLFLRARLFADTGLQAVYFGLGVYGWLNWLFGGEGRKALRVSRATRGEWLALAAVVPPGTWGLREVLLAAGGAAPAWDALTTALSLAAQFLLARKRIENWLLWIAADALYVPLYLSRDLPLTAALYGLFLVLCVTGAREWRRSLERAERPA